MDEQPKVPAGSMQTQVVAQWITSLAISVVCCAVLFIVFAGYIVQLHESTNLMEVRIEVLQEKQNQLTTELASIRRAPVVNIQNIPNPVSPSAVVPNIGQEGADGKVEAPKAEGVELSGPAPAEAPAGKAP